MNYSKILEELNNASLFELYRLEQAIRRSLEDPVRIKENQGFAESRAGYRVLRCRGKPAGRSAHRRAEKDESPGEKPP